MPKSSRTRKRRPAQRRQSLTKHPLAFPILMALVAGFIVLGVFQYTLSVALGSAFVAGFIAWRWWQGLAPARPSKPRSKKKTRRRK
jgi:lipopolysaccharide export LptBFGC system permease protein LptF